MANSGGRSADARWEKKAGRIQEFHHAAGTCIVGHFQTFESKVKVTSHSKFQILSQSQSHESHDSQNFKKSQSHESLGFS